MKEHYACQVHVKRKCNECREINFTSYKQPMKKLIPNAVGKSNPNQIQIYMWSGKSTSRTSGLEDPK
jgi:phage FluMu protein Com